MEVRLKSIESKRPFGYKSDLNLLYTYFVFTHAQLTRKFRFNKFTLNGLNWRQSADFLGLVSFFLKSSLLTIKRASQHAILFFKYLSHLLQHIEPDETS